MKSAALQSQHYFGTEKKRAKEHDLNSAARMNNFLQGVERRAFITARLATKDDEEALDIVQDAMFKLVQKYSGRSDDELGALFHTILNSKINDWYRRQQVRNRWRVFFRPASSDSEDKDMEPENRVPQTQFLEPEKSALNGELSEQLTGAVAQLPLRQQQALVLRAWEGYDIAQTADIMKCSQGSVKTHYSRAIHSLREKLGDT